MVVQDHEAAPAPDVRIDGGVLKDARRRQRRQRAALASALLAILAVLGLLLFDGSGGGGGDAGRSGRGHGSNPSSGHAASRVGAPSSFSPPTVGRSGLLSPGVGWAVNGLGFYMTWDGGKHWSDVRVPGLSGDVLAGFMAATSPGPRTLVVAIADAGSSYGTCEDPAGSSRQPIGELAVSTDAGRTWRAAPFPSCRVPTQISFIDARTGFAETETAKPGRPVILYGTVDGGRRWRRIGRVPKYGAIDFTSRADGWLQEDGATGIYRTTDGGKTWHRTTACRQPSDRAGATDCGPIQAFGTSAVEENIHGINGVGVYTTIRTTSDGGASWTTHRVAVNPKIEGSPATIVSAASPHDLFVYYQAGVLARSTDGGRSWRELQAPRFRGGAFLDFISADYGWIQDGGSIYATTDGGKHWQRMKQKHNRPPVP